MKAGTKKFISLLIFVSAPAFLWSDYPPIGSLKPYDILFKQLQNDVAIYYQATCRNREELIPQLALFRYTVQKDETLFSIAARLNLPYETISSLNRISQAAEFSTRGEILIPNSPGLFVPLEPADTLEEIMRSWRANQGLPGEKIIVTRNGKEETFLFYRGERFHTVERAYFLKILFRFPVDHVVLTSSFGVRTDPFSGHASFHGGIDLAAPLGTDVYAAREGTVRETGYHDCYGKYVLLVHAGGYETLYGHLRDISVKTGEKVNAGSRLGSIGMTGRTTGPHLHFEVRKDGKSLNPGSILPERLGF